ncbi:MAG: hypothetical protein NXI20_11085 [bacterium]|nr:hypothetical protein [bacterium]
MDYKNWTYEEGSLIVEKYTGAFNKEFILKAQEELYAPIPTNKAISMLTDLSEATFPNLSVDDLKEILSVLDKNHHQYTSFQGAMVTSLSQYEDFEVAHNYAKQAHDKNIVVMIFHSLDSALDWLHVSAENATSIRTKLASKNDIEKAE